MHPRVLFCTVETYTLHDKLFEGKKLEECDENLNYTYFEEQYEQLFPLDVYFLINDTMCMQVTHATTKDVVRI